MSSPDQKRATDQGFQKRSVEQIRILRCTSKQRYRSSISKWYGAEIKTEYPNSPKSRDLCSNGFPQTPFQRGLAPKKLQSQLKRAFRHPYSEGFQDIPHRSSKTKLKKLKLSISNPSCSTSNLKPQVFSPELSNLKKLDFAPRTSTSQFSNLKPHKA